MRGQLLRFVIAGVGVTAFSALIYLALAGGLRSNPLAANAVSHCCGVVAGYLIHSRWSFRASSSSEAAAALRFAIVSGIGFALNSLWVWLAVQVLHAPAWAPVPAMIAITPLASFALNRWWVFGAARTMPQRSILDLTHRLP